MLWQHTIDDVITQKVPATKKRLRDRMFDGRDIPAHFETKVVGAEQQQADNEPWLDHDHHRYALRRPHDSVLTTTTTGRKRILLVASGFYPFSSNKGGDDASPSNGAASSVSALFTRYAKVLAASSAHPAVEVLYPSVVSNAELQAANSYWASYNVTVFAFEKTLHRSYPSFYRLKQSYNILHWILAQAVDRARVYDAILFPEHCGLALYTLQLKESGEQALAAAQIVVISHFSSRESDLYNARKPDKVLLYQYDSIQ